MSTQYLPENKAERKALENAKVKQKWWTQKGDEVAQGVFSIVNNIEKNTIYRNEQNLKFAKLYHNMEMLGFGPGLYAQSLTNYLTSNRVTLNVIKSCVDTVAAKISQNTPRVEFITSDGDFQLQTKAKKLTKYMRGRFDAMNVYELAQRIFVDSCVFGTGALHIFTDNGEVKAERVLMHELVIDDAEAIYGEPQQMHRRKYMSRDQLLELFPESATDIIDAVSEDQQNNTADQVKIIESWHLKSGPNANDGYHAISIDNCTLLYEPYEKSNFPFCFLRWSTKLIGFFGMGLAEELVGIQFEINKILRNIQLAQHLMSSPKIAVEATSMVNTAHLTNEPGAIIKYTGTKPEAMVWPSMGAEIYQHFITLYNKAYEITGVSQTSASSQREKGLDSAAAQRTVQDIKSERFILCGQRYDRFFVDVAKLVIDLSRDIYSDGYNKGTVIATGRNRRRGNQFIESIDWNDVDMDQDEYNLEAFPGNILPSTPAGKMQAITEFIQAGFFDKAYGRSLLNFPDMESLESLEEAALDDVRMVVGGILTDGDYTPPDKYMDLQLALKVAHSSYLRARTQKGVKKKNLELLGQFIDEITDLLQPEAPPPAPQDMGGQPMATPMAPPTSQIMPMVPPGAPPQQ